MNDVVIIGTGALATRMGWHLTRAGADVTLVGTWRDALDVIAEEGVALEEDGELKHVPAWSTRLGDPVDPAPLVLVLVKSHRTAAIAPHAIRAAAPGGLILTLQNGLGNRELLEAEALSLDRAEGDRDPPVTIAAGVTSVGAMSIGPGRARAGGPGSTVLGAPADMPQGPKEVLEEFSAMLRGEGLDVEVEDDLDALVWRKLAVNCAINPLSAILRAPNGQLLEDEESHSTLRAAAAEVSLVATALGIEAGGPDELAELAETVARRTKENRSSMLQDVERGAPTEIDALCGAVVRHGNQTHVKTPVNLRLWRDVIAIEDRAISGSGEGDEPDPEGSSAMDQAMDIIAEAW